MLTLPAVSDMPSRSFLRLSHWLCLWPLQITMGSTLTAWLSLSRLECKRYVESLKPSRSLSGWWCWQDICLITRLYTHHPCFWSSIYASQNSQSSFLFKPFRQSLSTEWSASASGPSLLSGLSLQSLCTLFNASYHDHGSRSMAGVLTLWALVTFLPIHSYCYQWPPRMIGV